MRSRRVAELAVGILAALLLSGGALYATAPHDRPHTQPTTTVDTSTGACQEGHTP